jgi:ubiquinone/menaquinone biosynthesis C-methylase UbiE
VMAVEPVEERRAQLLEAVPGVEALAGTAEEIPLADRSVDAVVCGQAFHWFDADRALAEIHRVLRPGGGLGLVWNSRDLGDSLQARLDELLETVRERSSRHWNDESSALVAASPFFGEFEHRSWPSEQRLSLEGVLEMVASRSYVASLDEAARRDLLERVREVVAGEPEPIVLRYVVDVFAADRQ